MGIRLKGFDYTRPYFYMVTVKCRAGFPELVRVAGETGLRTTWRNENDN